MNRNGAPDSGEPPLADQQLYLFDADGQYVGGTYQTPRAFTGSRPRRRRLPGRVRLALLVGTPGRLGAHHHRLALSHGLREPAGSATADFGWRPIVRSTDVASPLSSYVGSNGLRVNSYNDVVDAREVYDAVMLGTVGAEAQFVTIRFDYSPNSSTVAAWQGTPGSFSDYNAVSYDNYISWLTEGDQG